MDTAYRRDEIVSSSHASKQLGEILDRARRAGRVVLSRNNRLDAVLLPIEEYEELVEDLDHLLAAMEIGERKAERGKRIPWAELRARHGL